MTKSIAAFDPVNERIRKMSRRISGAFERRSITTKVASNPKASAASPSVRPDVHPYCCALTMS